MSDKQLSERIDTILLLKNLAASRREAQALISSGNVIVNNQKCFKSGHKFKLENINIKILKKNLKYVSYGGLKLAKIADKYQIDFKDKNVIDIGSSTGGFSDYALQQGAKTVTAIDVGYGIIDWKLRNNPRLELIERCNFRYFKSEKKFDIILIDVSFISLKLLVENISALTHSSTLFIPLIKPQFEAGKEHIARGGIVKNPAIHKIILTDLIDIFAKNNLFLKGITFTALKAKKGNIEYMGYFSKIKLFDDSVTLKLIDDVVNEAFTEVNY